MVPHVTAGQMKEIDRLMVSDLGVELLQMMEQAGRALTEVARPILRGALAGRTVVILVGPGSNGGGGMAGARLMAATGARVTVVLAQEAGRLRPIPAHQHAILRRMQVPITVFRAPDGPRLEALLDAADLVVDALLGYSLVGAPRGEVAAMIRETNRAGRPTLALDLPSGLHPDTGRAFDPCIRAHATVTLALPKRGLLVPGVELEVGRLWVGDIGVPGAIYERLGLDVGPLFSRASLIRIEDGAAVAS